MTWSNSPPPGLALREATERDLDLIIAFIRELAEYERLAHQVVLDPAVVRESLFGERRYAEVILAELEGRPAGFALFFHNFSTFLGRPGLYLEDLFVREGDRGKGIGLALLSRLADLAQGRGCGRLEWAVLDWNEPAIGFYRRLGARPMEDWRIFRLSGEPLERLAKR